MDLLPKKSTDFADPVYWKNFFAKRSLPFECYSDLSEILELYIKRQDKILQLGCGNSTLASDLFDFGFKDVHSIDTDERVIQQQRIKNKERAGLSFAKDDATSLSSDSELYTACIDKGTLDALLPPNPSEEETRTVCNMFDEVHRVLKPNGRYLIVTLAQPHICKAWLEHFMAKKQYIIRVHEFPTTVSSFPMPVFILVATKLLKPMPMELPIELKRATSANSERFTKASLLLDGVHAQQELSKFINHCSKKLEDPDVHIVLNGSTGPRYAIRICDSPDVKEIKSLTAFVVPIGRDHEWTFKTSEGREEVRKQVKKDRVMFAYLYRNQKYPSMESVKDELSAFVSRFRPIDYKDKIEFVTMGETDVSKRVAEGSSEFNGDWVVEDVTVENQIYRRLIFMESQNLIQSEALLKRNKKGKYAIDFDILTCDHHVQMICGLSLLNPNLFDECAKEKMKCTVLGLGGGLLVHYIHRHFPHAFVTGVDIDPAIENIAYEHFGLPKNDSRLNIQVVNALAYLEQVAQEKAEKLDALFVDIAGSSHDDGLSCPPASFLEDNVLKNMHNSLTQNGLLAMNVVTRDLKKLESIKKQVKKYFPSLYSIKFSTDVNEVLLGLKVDVVIDVIELAKRLPKKKWTEELIKSIPKMKKVV
ncbi:unnamed protein product [Auanema sp. JU1783]|nr:unnamed protein product [Auanema sp. JU1783]